MERTELIEAIRKVCEIQNDIRIDMRVRGEGWFFDAAYIFLGEKEVYVTDALYIIRIDELDTKSLNRIYQKYGRSFLPPETFQTLIYEKIAWSII